MDQVNKITGPLFSYRTCFHPTTFKCINSYPSLLEMESYGDCLLLNHFHIATSLKFWMVCMMISYPFLENHNDLNVLDAMMPFDGILC
jgi:hypothetical protein